MSLVRLFTVTAAFLLCSSLGFAQVKLSGEVVDRISGQPLIGASVIVKGTTNGEITDLDGKFALSVEKLPVTLSVNFMGYESGEFEVAEASTKLKFKLVTKNFELKAVEISESRISDKQKEEPLTVESMDVIAIREAPTADFYEGLGTLKGVDLTSASIGFKVINTRGFNSTSPVRSLQIIDGVDNQAPGLNFSLGNFLGASDLDLMKVDLIQGASSAFYGPNAFNGVISMTTKDPFLFPGLSVSAKAGERNLMEGAVRYAKVFQNKDSVDKFAFKINLFFLRADDWVADNMDPVYQSEVGADNWGGYNAVNRYGDEEAIAYVSPSNQINLPGLGYIFRTGYEERDIVDYDTENFKTNLALHYKVKDENQIILSSNFGTGTTVYQGDNRYSLKDILFFQNRLEYKTPKGFIRVYGTNEDAGNSYDAVFTALLLQDMAKDNSRWASDYGFYWADDFANRVKDLPNFPSPQVVNGQVIYDFDLANAIMNQFSDSLQFWHDLARQMTDLGVSSGGVTFNDNQDRLVPGTPAFEAAFNDIVSRTSFEEGGSRFFDRSALYHIHGEQRFELDSTDFTEMEITVGANYRMYRPNSRGSIFSDTTERITNQEYGAYIGASKWLAEDKLKVSATIRVDKNQNFPYVASPAASLVYKPNDKDVVRMSFSSAIRNPTLQDQYLYYNVGPAILLGNLTGFDSLVTIESARAFASAQNPDSLVWFDIAPLVPEKVRTIEVGYRTTIGKRFYVDAGYYFSFYRDFLGFNVGLDPVIDQNTNLFNPSKTQAYRIAANARDAVTTQGFSIGMNYYFKKFFTASGNYSWNKLDRRGSDDPIIPAFNTPEHKFNIGFSGREISTLFRLSKKEDARTFTIRNYGFGVNYKWVQGFLFEGSPQFTGFVPSYDVVDLQINKYLPSIKTTFKVGAGNLLNNAQFQVYGGPRIGRMAYFSVLFEPDRKN